jgi:hypothetical protein
MDKASIKEILNSGMETIAGGYFTEETWEKADYCVARGWNTAKFFSSKDSE